MVNMVWIIFYFNILLIKKFFETIFFITTIILNILKIIIPIKNRSYNILNIVILLM